MISNHDTIDITNDSESIINITNENDILSTKKNRKIVIIITAQGATRVC
jgi:hypothetical protein